jgi:hypothetical protein
VQTVRYHDGVTEVRLGDRVATRYFIFLKAEGRVAYVPGISPKNNEMEFDGLTWVGIRTTYAGTIGTVVLPDTQTLQKSVRFLGRGPADASCPIQPGEQVFEDAEGRPL